MESIDPKSDLATRSTVAREPESTTEPTVTITKSEDLKHRTDNLESAPTPPPATTESFPGKLEVPSRPGTSAGLRKKSAPFPSGYGASARRPSALERWQTATYTNKGERAESIPSRAWIPLMGQLAGDGDESDSSTEDDSLDNVEAEDDELAKSTDVKSIRSAGAGPKRKTLMRRILMMNEHCKSTGRARTDGRLRITVHETAHKGYMANALGAVAHSMRPKRSKTGIPSKAIPSAPLPQPHLNIVVMVVGSRGDVQPFLRIGKYLKDEFGHRVRIATHPTFRDLVEKDSGLEFFSVGGDPSELMAFMVKNPGMIPTLETVKAGEIGRRRAAMAEMFDGFWRACIHATEDEKTDTKFKSADGGDVFIADAIIANPPSFAHIHCAEALGVPLHLVFTFPYTPTQAFPHPLASIKKSNVDQGYTNFISYPLVEIMTWQGLGDLINDFRVNTLALDPVSTLWAPCATYRMHVPFTYLWSPGLVPKPEDWGEEIDVSGFVFLDLASAFQPPTALVDFLNAGEPPIYIGFGSIVVDDAERFTDMIFDAIQMAGVRALVSRGWGGFGRDDVPDNIFMLDNTPHDWLFPKIKGCVHHGGAGTTAIGLKCGLPTMIVPFFGDQYFWGSMVGKSGAGPDPVPYKHLTAEKLAEGITYLLTDEAKSAAGKIAESINREGDGAINTVASFERHLKMYGPPTMSCSIIKSEAAVWKVKGTHLRLGAMTAQILVDSGELSWKNLRLLRHTEWNDFEGPGEPVTAVAESLKNSLRDIFGGVASAPIRLGRTAKRRVKHRIRMSEEKRHKTGENSTGKEVDQKSAQAPPTKKRAKKVRKQSLTPVPGPDQYATDISKSFGQTALAIARAPTSLIVALAQGFHNAPRLYGDDTVRRPTRVSGIRSGLVASRREFVYGFYDGVTGVVRLPIQGAKNEGAIGFLKGTGMGVSGLVLKSISAIVGPLGYSMQGVLKQVQRRRSPQKFVRRARIAQGQRDVGSLDHARRKSFQEEALAGWQVMQQLSRAIADEEDKRGIAGQLDKLSLDIAFLFVDVDRAKTCLNDLTAGKSLEDIMTGYKDWNVKSMDPMTAKRGTWSNNRA
ncbi:UDP-glucose,sterol transferase [Pochonia chlamydosporia 170]|uniref:UDP-glucose,sterol transferase n=1 Tax=Pochonia chlamydosporia 170 TaxID=1380566 RepID=A0A179F2K0_METCM|nr:UDP-glucose,sterol transferase [Pochonia chlamydosporia 170]OAQ59353.1 UDP-glucose,sterol transferase [Pochonia chlamydosporia 170]